MFHFPGCPPMNLWIQFMVTGHYPSRVPPFGDLRIIAHLRLPEAFRSLSRPSSAISAMASTLRSYSLDLCLLSLIRLLRLKRTTESIISDSFPLCLLTLPVQFSRCVEVSSWFLLQNPWISSSVPWRSLKTIQSSKKTEQSISRRFAGFSSVFPDCLSLRSSVNFKLLLRFALGPRSYRPGIRRTSSALHLSLERR